MAPHAEAVNHDLLGASVILKSHRTTKVGAPSDVVVATIQPCSLLRVQGDKIVNENDELVILKGAGLGGQLNMENFITGYPGHEHEHRAAMAEVLGPEKAQFFFDKLIEYFFTDVDAAFFASLGLNCIRVPFNYRHFIDDQNPSVLRQEGFRLLDRIIEICGRHNLYVILDLHAVPGGQNQDWHSDSGIAKALFWEHRVFQDQVVSLWEAIAKHYVGNPVIAGYNPLNEPADPLHYRLTDFYVRVEKAIRAVDPEHILYIDGNTYAMDFSHFPPEVLPNAVYACHDYATFGFPIPGQAPYTGTEVQKAKLLKSFNRKADFMRRHGVPIWNGEFGPVYASTATDPHADITNSQRYTLLQEQLDIYAASQINWSIWLYKDIGYQGMVHVDPGSKYMQLIAPFLSKKQHLGLDFWGCVDKSGVQNTYDPFIKALEEQIPEKFRTRKYPHVWTFGRHVERVVRECLMSEYLGWEFTELFRGLEYEELDELAACFKLENCLKREGLNEILRRDAQRSMTETSKGS
ncbi:hypothetical protein H2198_002774 [Neophaeococcomyces mojaviensis]|uniref:Uncharacterized protein n=1 Tax=Neophaeococcomyces mojaviensis TaxID=3383035 RepID=A0ACC3ADU0_9EURO|nr:hypothetical protein H2198_002774 [Knufia sp. JES_112]